MREKNVIILVLAAIILLALGVFVGTSLIGGNNTTNETNQTNITINQTNNTTVNDTNATQKLQTTKKTTQKKSSTKSDNEVTYDEELNAYFDSNGKTAYEGQFPKGTSKSEMKQAMREMEEYN